MEESYKQHELIMATPINETRTPARLRLSVTTNTRETKNSAAFEEGLESSYLSDSHDRQSSLREDDLISNRRRALFEPLGPTVRHTRDGSPDNLLPPPDFEQASYPRGWVVGKKRKLVNVDVVESMRRIAVHEMNRKDREINGLNEQLEEDARTMEHLQMQLQSERQKRLHCERENSLLQTQVKMLMNMFDDSQVDEESDR